MKAKVVERLKPLKPQQTAIPSSDAQLTRMMEEGMPTERVVVWWCAGCGCYHNASLECWNADGKNPTIKPADGSVFFQFTQGAQHCYCFVRDGQITWGSLSAHGNAGKTLPLPHEETWRGVAKPGEGWDKVESK